MLSQVHLYFAIAGLLTTSDCSPVARDVTKANAEAAYRQLQTWYNETSGLWQEQWWHSGSALTTISNLAAIDETIKGDVVGTLSNTFTKAQTTWRGFLNDYYDDEAWWALGWISAYDLTGNAEYLSMAESIYEDMNQVFGQTNCSSPASNAGATGGIWWDKSHSYVNAIANELFFHLAASLANRVQGKNYKSIAERQWSWFASSGMLNSETNVINDGLTGTCENNLRTIWSYNQGVVLGALVELTRAASEQSYTRAAHTIADAAIANLAQGGTLRETCEATTVGCDDDQSQFKGIFARNLMKLQQASPRPEYATFLDDNAESIWTRDRSGDQLGLHWTGPFIAPADMSTQTSAMDCLIGSLAT